MLALPRTEKDVKYIDLHQKGLGTVNRYKKY